VARHRRAGVFGFALGLICTILLDGRGGNQGGFTAALAAMIGAAALPGHNWRGGAYFPTAVNELDARRSALWPYRCCGCASRTKHDPYQGLVKIGVGPPKHALLLWIFPRLRAAAASAIAQLCHYWKLESWCRHQPRAWAIAQAWRGREAPSPPGRTIEENVEELAGTFGRYAPCDTRTVTRECVQNDRENSASCTCSCTRGIRAQEA
jgi:hypothetical protein